MWQINLFRLIDNSFRITHTRHCRVAFYSQRVVFVWLKHKAPPWESIEWDNFLMWYINVPSTKSINRELFFLTFLASLWCIGWLRKFSFLPLPLPLNYIHLSMVMGSRYLLWDQWQCFDKGFKSQNIETQSCPSLEHRSMYMAQGIV